MGQSSCHAFLGLQICSISVLTASGGEVQYLCDFLKHSYLCIKTRIRNDGTFCESFPTKKEDCWINGIGRCVFFHISSQTRPSNLAFWIKGL